jgi:hypothetical protein
MLLIIITIINKPFARQKIPLSTKCDVFHLIIIYLYYNLHVSD